MMNHYRENLPGGMPRRIEQLPVVRGYPVPWFVAEVDGVFDFRVVDPAKLRPALKQKRCWICGQPLGRMLTFSIGPMCAINRVISEPPSHTECARWAAKACPFMNQQEGRRRAFDSMEGLDLPAGEGIMRQPGVTCLWTTREFFLRPVENGVLFKLGEPVEVEWFREGRLATREEVQQSIESGYPILLKAAEAEGAKAVAELEKEKTRAMRYLP